LNGTGAHRRTRRRRSSRWRWRCGRRRRGTGLRRFAACGRILHHEHRAFESSPARLRGRRTRRSGRSVLQLLTAG
jgi:hypothetical protein